MAIELVRHLFVGDKELLEPIGAGGFSVVWKARQAETGALFALKFPQVEVFLEHLRQEAGLASRFSDPQVVPILEVNLDVDPPHLVMPWVEGEPLALPQEAPPPEGILPAIERVADLAAVLARLHAAGIAHGDVKPGNVLIDGDGRVRLLDLGLARLAVESNLERSLAQSLVSVDGRSIAGTLDYMAPELFEGAGADSRTDVYGLGVLLHHVLTGRPPAFGVSPSELNPYLPPGLPDLLRSMLEQDPARRRADASELTQPLSWLSRAERRCLRRKNGHQRRRVFQRRMATLRKGLRAMLGVLSAPMALLAFVYALTWGMELSDQNQAVEVLTVLAMLVIGLPLCFLGLLVGMTTINAWCLGVPEGLYKNRPGHPLWSFMMQ